MCAGITTFNALRNSGARPGDVVAVLGLGGLGHLGVQYAAKMGFHTVGIARGKDKESLARQLGATTYIDSQAQDPAAELLKLGGAKVILATATSGVAMAAVQGGLAVNGTLLILGAAASMQVSPMWLLSGCRSIKGWYSGTSIDSEDTLAFSARAGVRSMNETFPLERVAEAYDRMMSGKARFRVVLALGNQGVRNNKCRLSFRERPFFRGAKDDSSGNSFLHRSRWREHSMSRPHERVMTVFRPMTRYEAVALSYGQVTTERRAGATRSEDKRGTIEDPAIFGPERDDYCACGKCVGIVYHGMICDRCGVKISASAREERSNRFGHIALAEAMPHPFAACFGVALDSPRPPGEDTSSRTLAGSSLQSTTRSWSRPTQDRTSRS